MYFKFDEAALNNLLKFLDRVDYKGIKEVVAINQIISILENPIDTGSGVSSFGASNSKNLGVKTEKESPSE